LFEEGEDTFSIPVAEGYPRKIRGSRFPLDSRTWAGWILRAQEEPQTIRFQLRTGMPVLYPGERVHLGAGFLGMPLLAKNRVTGALLLTRKGKPFSSNEVRLVRILCNQAAIAVENARVYGRLEQMAATDALTGLFNRRYFQQALEREMSRADRGSNSIALLLLDIDHFKFLNDNYGHALGDTVLKKIADVLQGTLRKGDVLARYGGEEFVVLLPQATYEGAQEFAQRIWKAVGTARIHPGGGSHRVTASVGWALLPDDADTAESLVENADRALYFAKETGRNKVAGYHLLRAGVGS
jgi:diguanylate cyclase (GGDEF)-like protein